MTLWIVIIVLKPPVQWGHSLPNPLFTKSPSTIERFRIPLQSKRFLILFDYIFLHTTKTFHFYLIWIRLEGYYIFKVFKDLPDFCYSKFLQAVQRNETDNFQFFYSRKFHTISLSLMSIPLPNPNIWPAKSHSKNTLWDIKRKSISTKTHTHTLWYCCEFQESKRLKCPSLVSTLKVRRNCTSSSLFCLRKLQFAGVLSFKGANSTSQHPFQLHPSGEENTYTNSEWTCIFSRSDNLF